MTRQEAFAVMIAGMKVTHYSFSSEEYYQLVNSRIIADDDTDHTSTFWNQFENWRKDGWSIFTEAISEPPVLFKDKLEVVLLHGSISLATDKAIASIYSGQGDLFGTPYHFHNYEEMAIDGGDIIQFGSAANFIEYVYNKIMADSSINSQ